MDTLLVALAGVFTALFPAVGAYFGYKANKTANRIDRKTETNHGMEPWQYLEMILEIKEKVVDNAEYQHNRNHDLLNAITVAKGKADIVSIQVEELRGIMEEHTRQDEQNFDALKAAIIAN